MRYNPFQPGSIVSPGMFSGRVEELIKLERALFQTKHGNATHFLIQGERGIGKSSLFFYLQEIAKGKLKPIKCDPFSFIIVSIELEPSNSYSDIIRKVGAELQRTIASLKGAEQLAKNAWKFLSRWEVMGVKYSAQEQVPIEPHQLLEDLTHTIERTVSDLVPSYDGILILIDEADKPPAKANLGEFVKVLTERLSKRGCRNVSLGLAGISGIIQKLHQSHESSPRVFEILTLDPLQPQERIDVVRKGLMLAEEKSGIKVTIDLAAEELISDFSEGYPHFIQQFAYCAFEEDSDNSIHFEDVLEGAFKEHGAFQQLGQKYFDELYFEQIGSDEYRAVLRAMAEHWDAAPTEDGWVTKAQIRKATSLREHTLNNAIHALKGRRIIIPRQGSAGIYRLPSRSFAVWIKAYTTDTRHQPSQGQTPKIEQG